MAVSVIWPLPVAAKLPYSVTSNAAASRCLPKNNLAALLGPIVWLLDGPLPILYNSLKDFIIEIPLN